jgi:DNA adenine methylase
MKPLIKWSGGKGDEIERIVPHIPTDYDTYIEPFVGGGALYFHLEPQKAVINDIHPGLISLYKQVKEGNGGRIYEMMEAHPNTEEEYYKVRDEFQTETELEKAFHFYYLRKTCYRGMLRYNSSGKFNIPFGRYKKINYEDVRYVGYQELLERTEVMNSDFEEVFQRYGSNSNNFCFLDQPYDSVFTNYGYCQFERKDQERLAKTFKVTQMKCLMVVGDTPLIRELYDGYIEDSYPKKYKFKLHSGRVGDNINTNHLIIKNY